jgi:iron complex transport system permease protein
VISAAPRLTRRRLLGSVLLAGFGLALALLVGASLGAGRTSLWTLVPGGAAPTEIDRSILLDVRIPRVLLAAILGGALTVAGSVFQALLRNPLADPYVLGVSGGASIGGVVALLVFGASGSLAGRLAIPAAAFAGALVSLGLIERLATVRGQMSVHTLLLTGAIFNAFSAALIYFLQSVASLQELHGIVFYLMGRIPSFAFRELAVLGGAVVATTVALVAMARDYNALSLGEEGARQLGVDVERVKRRTFVLGSLLTALAVSVAGLIGFVGLVVPHVLRLVLGPDHRLLLPTAFVLGAAFLVLADLVARVLVAPNELPVGVVTALVGGPFFLYLLRRTTRAHSGS